MNETERINRTLAGLSAGLSAPTPEPTSYILGGLQCARAELEEALDGLALARELRDRGFAISLQPLLDHVKTARGHLDAVETQLSKEGM